MIHPVSVKRFPNDGSGFSALYAVKEWLSARGYITGSTQRDSPIGVHHESECSGISNWRNLSPDERSALHGRITWENGGAREGDAVLTFVVGEGDPAIPVERWGRDHWSTFGFVATWCKSYGAKGLDIRSKSDNMRTDHLIHPEMEGRQAAAIRRSLESSAKKYPTRLRDGEIENHDDWSCLEDIEAAGLIRREGTGHRAVIFMTDAGLVMSAKLTAHETRGGSFGDFEVEL